MSPWVRILIYLVAAPVIGCLLAGWDRRISARMQSRRGPPILQPLYDVLKLWQKQNIAVHRSQNLYIVFFLLLVISSGHSPPGQRFPRSTFFFPTRGRSAGITRTA